MSVLPDGKRVCCDGNECHATAPLPVALHHKLSDFYSESEASNIRGWLFAGVHGAVKHFCPQCGAFYLPQALDGDCDLVITSKSFDEAQGTL